MSLCDRDMRQLLCNWIIMNMIFMKCIWNLYYIKKEILFQAFSCKFCEFLHNDGFWDFLQVILFDKFLDGCFLIFSVEPAFCERDKNHKFDSFKTDKSQFFNEVAFYFVWLLHCIRSVRLSLNSVWMRENVEQNNSEYGHFLRSVVL